jgi:cell filamentation protein
MAKGFRTWDDYVIPGTSVLKNIENIADGEQLRRYEEAQALQRTVELAATRLPATFDCDHMKAIHRIFQDVYKGAGEERVGPVGQMSKEGHAYYPGGPALTEAAHAEYAKLASKDLLRRLDKDQFVDELAERWGELNVIHSFREGNTERSSCSSPSSRSRLATESTPKHSRLVRRCATSSCRHVSIAKTRGVNTRLAAVLSKVIEPIQSTPAAPASLSPEPQEIVDLNKRSYPTSATEIGHPAQGNAPEARGYQPPAHG